MSLESQNNKTIERALNNAVKRANQSIQRGLEQLLAWGMEECLTLHEELENGKHTQHLIVDKGYGWVLYKDGSRISQGIKSRSGYPEMQVDVVLGDLQSEAENSGWSGFVVACMEGVFDVWSIRFETLVQQTTINTMSLFGGQFEDIFKPMPRG